ncbi:MAG: gamma carbonic anhydrase family protein [Sphaerochaetaceae bacterium]|nr:gamma carbonic anhydrase family protein [Sphaerochaetaceae bacterium]MDD3941323.1 gamma carbonic anhydrase family protein [Sphaerochaetaceae bacterium]MDX9940303.1 gamma carbonic anhydrase family protein [Sphaerochaetaceae bacterium]
MILSYEGKHPAVEQAYYIAPSADIIGDVTLGTGASVWFNATVRGDISSVTIGERTNIQDNAVVHVNTELPTVIGNDVTVGHGAIIHACTIGNGCLVGMGSIILDGAVIADECLVAAGALVPPRKYFPPRSLIVGSPAKVVRTLSEEEIDDIRRNTKNYEMRSLEFAAQAQQEASVG